MPLTSRLTCALLLTVGSWSPVGAQVPQAERDALIALYDATNGPVWTNSAGWLDPAGTECGWYGVTCSDDRSHVSMIGLDGNGLVGTLPGELGALGGLHALSLRSNQLSGTIPTELGSLSLLDGLHLSFNELTGAIPPELGNLTSLQALSLRSNQLSGAIPPEIANLTSLTNLALASNRLTGTIPPGLGALTDLVELSLYTNQLTGTIPPELSGLSNLTYLAFSSNQIAGTIPPGLAGLTLLSRLYLDSNQLAGTIPPGFGDLNRLGALSLYANQLTGTIPSELGNLSNLTYLALSSNQLTGTIPSELGNLSALEELSLRSNHLSGTIPPELGNLTALHRLYLDSNQLIGSVPPHLANLTALDELSLHTNQLTGTVPSELGSLTTLTFLALSNNRLTATIPPRLGALDNLVRLYLDTNQLTGTIPSELGDLVHLTALSLYANQLTGTIPPELGDLTGLTYLALSSNQLTGTIPPRLGDLTALGELSSRSNQLSGTIPPELGNLISLDQLHLDSNQLTGTIPSELESLGSLRVLQLYGNQLTGTIPAGLGNLASLEWLNLSGNRLAGIIPPELGSLTRLEGLFLDDNLLLGTIPPALGNLALLRNLHLRSNRLTGPAPSGLLGLGELASTDLRWNGLYTSDDQLRAFLDARQVDGDWESTQTVAPADVVAVATAPDVIAFDWTPITYTWDSGRYRVFGRTTPWGVYELLGATADKASSSLTLTGLAPGTSYSLTVQSVTDPHGSNQNTVESEHGPEVIVATPGSGDCRVTCSASAPPTAEVGEAVVFSGAATAPNCAQAPTFAWTFGDGQGSTLQSPSHAYAGPGSYGWSMTASAQDASCTRTGAVTVFGPGAECGNGICEEGETAWTCPSDCGLGPGETGRAGGSSNRAAVPAVVGGVGGVGGTYWVSEGMLHNPTASPAAFTVAYTPDHAPTQVQTAGPLTLGAGGAVFWDNLVQELFGVTDNGCLQLSSDQPLMLVSRTFNDQPQGSYGQFLGAIGTRRALSMGDRAYLVGLREDAAFRSNVIIQEVGGIETEARLTLFLPDGSMVGERTLTVPALTKTQDRLLALGFSDLDGGYATLEVAAGGRIVAIASVVDQGTGDAMTVDALHASQARLATAGKKTSVAISAAKATVDFTWSPHRPVVGEAVQFTDLSTGDSQSWSWHFGDGGASSAQHPVHAYGAAGTHTVTLVVSRSGFGSQFISKSITVDEIQVGSAHYLLAVVAHLPGEGGTQWRSDLWVLNPFPTAQQVWLEYHPEGSTGVERQRLVVRAGEQVTVEDVVAALFSATGDGKGSLHVFAPEGVFVNSRTFNLGDEGTFGQAVPALGGGDLLASGETGVLLKLKSTATHRCNVGFTGFDGVATSVRVTLYSADGGEVSPLGSKTYNLPPSQNLQVNRIFEDMGLTGEYEAAMAEVEVLAGGRVYASNVDGRTGDGELIPAMRR